MALDEALWHAVRSGQSPPVLRLYRWQPATVSLGYAQRTNLAVNLAACAELGIQIVRRMTGGRAVLHDREVTYAVVSPDRTPLFPAGLLSSYRIIADIVGQTLRACGLDVQLCPGQPAQKRFEAPPESACFTAVSHYELTCRGCKIAGSSQKRGEGVFLQHGSIPVDLDLDILYRVLTPGVEACEGQGVSAYGHKIGWVNRWLDHPLTVDMLELQLIETFARCLKITLLPDEVTSSEWTLAQQLASARYLNPDWTFKESAQHPLSGH
ncbi:biotin/lipoate A/B protein ligase family protein [Desulfuromonas sp. AOP6]|uniref:lipoate--protein ligase family protein n=1 Tax=Desulfuromonas sp. AOP6 TaxID=1566351 RepID=UPI0012706E6D|nr:biotin/lipoate A/B protein ligase family protein [Desulfuromonas sp. AOP6]BCA80188.1 lipoate-protein ligase family protein [Desulfuromonas sp. AOP6]